MKELNELSKSIRFDNASKGFDPTEGGVNRYILLTISELCEAQDQLRDGHSPTEIYFSKKYGDDVPGASDAKRILIETKPEGFPIEVADAAIRLLDIAGKFDIDLDAIVIDVVDFETELLDDWLLGIVGMIATCYIVHNTIDYGFQFKIKQILSTIYLMCEKWNVDLDACMLMKLAFNRSRPPKHGRKF